jgi:hypothetical protein
MTKSLLVVALLGTLVVGCAVTEEPGPVGPKPLSGSRAESSDDDDDDDDDSSSDEERESRSKTSGDEPDDRPTAASSD